MGTPSSETERKTGLGMDLALSLGAAVWLAVGDSLAMRAAVGQTSNEIFFRAYSPLGLSPAAYILALLLIAGLVAGLASGILQRALIKAEGPPRLVISALLALGALSALLCRLRAETFNELPTFGRYIGALAAAALVYVLLVLSIPGLARARSGGSALRRAGLTVAALSILLAVVLLAGPAIEQVLLPNRARQGKAGRLPNVLVLMLDTVRADALSCIDPARGQTPRIDALAREGILFRKAISPAPWTVPSHGSLFTGLFPSQHGAVWGHPALDENLTTLAEILYDKGYRTAGFSENPSVSTAMGYGQGFEDYSDMYLNLRRAMVPGMLTGALAEFFDRPATLEYTKDSTAQFIRWLRGNALRDDEPPFFAFINYMAGHLPDYPRPEFNASSPPPDVLKRVRRISEQGCRYYLPAYALQPGDMDVLRMFYRGDVAYLDSRLGLLFDFLRRKNLLDNTIVVILADHGENFGDHGLIEHSFSLYNTVLHVPLVIRFPRKIPAGLVRETPVSTIHLFDTILDLAGVDRPVGAAGPSTGNPRRSLLDPAPEPEIYAECENLVDMLKLQLSPEPTAASFDFSPFDKSLECVYAGDRKLVRSSNGRVELYDTVTDWAETKDLSASEPGRVKTLLDKLAAWQKGLVKPKLILPPRSPDRSLKEALKSLGYIH